MAIKVKSTKTINPLHFEDLEPHRFEDLVRRLLYNFRDWNNIEATGRSGSDEGFDVRAWEKTEAVTNLSDEGEEGVHNIKGRLWQIQAKREKTIPPARMRALIKEGVNAAIPPYGYILAAATNISKVAYDVFREEIRKKGVAEFYFWGKDYLEDQLSLPQSDEILFTFFGLSLSPRRRSRTMEIKFSINNKNKILKLIFGSEHLAGQHVPRGRRFLLRDIKDDQYPYSGKYADFDKHRRWEEHDAVEVTPRGIFFKTRERYAYLDQTRKEWDFSPTIDLTLRKHNLDRSNEARLEDEGKNAERYWRHLLRRVQAKVLMYGFVPFEDMLIIDDKGDTEYTDPHVFIDFNLHGPFQFTLGNLVQHRETIGEDKIRDFKRVKIFPERFPPVATGTVYELNTLGLNADTERSLQYVRGPAVLYSFDDKLKLLSVNDLIHIPRKEDDRSSYERHAEVTHVYEGTVATLLKEHRSSHYRPELERSAGREISDTDKVVVYELHAVTVYENLGIIYPSDDW